MLKMDMKRGEISLFEMDGTGEEVAADVCVIMKRCADEFVSKHDIEGFIGFMASMEHTLNDEWFKLIFSIDPPSKYKRNHKADYEVDSNEGQ